MGKNIRSNKIMDFLAYFTRLKLKEQVKKNAKLFTIYYFFQLYFNYTYKHHY